jgi:hypothetical protein
VAIDRATRWVFKHIYGDMTDTSSVDFLRRLKQASPIKISKILTDNGSQFIDRFTTKSKKPRGMHKFDVACAEASIEHRLAPPLHPQTNGMVERFNGRINELLQQTWFDSAADLGTTLMDYLKLYNHHIPQRAIDGRPRIRYGVHALGPWVHDPEMDKLTQKMSRGRPVKRIVCPKREGSRKVGRNELCPCESGKKSKRCCYA